LSASPGEAPLQLFQTAKAARSFDSEYKAAILHALPASVLIEEVVPKGTSNSHPLKMQFLACPPNFTFKLHCHVSVELIIPLVGELWEKRLLGATLHPKLLARKSPLQITEEKGAFYKPPSADHDMAQTQELATLLASKIDSMGNVGEFVDRSLGNGQVMYNSVGSIHQSYTKDQGCLLLVLWCGVHGNLDCACCEDIAGGKDLFLP